jgi:hypothetical protein
MKTTNNSIKAEALSDATAHLSFETREISSPILRALFSPRDENIGLSYYIDPMLNDPTIQETIGAMNMKYP